MDAAWQVIANAGPLRPVPWHLGFFWLTLALAAVILIGAVVIVWLDRWRKRSGSERLSDDEQLAKFQKSYDNGELSREEFERIRALLSSAPQTPAKPAGPGNPPVV